MRFDDRSDHVEVLAAVLEGVFQLSQMADMRGAEAASVEDYAVCLPFEQGWCMGVHLRKGIGGREVAGVSGMCALYVFSQQCHG